MTAHASTSVTDTVEPHYEFHWEQDHRQRVLMLSGVVDVVAASHLESAIIDLGSRRLVLDLSSVTSLDPAAADAMLRIMQRLGERRVSIVVDGADGTSLVVSDVPDFPASA